MSVIFRTHTSLPMPLIIPGLRLWHSAADPLNTGVIPSNSSGLSVWWNKNAWGGNNTQQGTGANQPTYTHSVINGRHGVVFDGTNDYLLNGAVTPLAISTLYSIYCVVSLSSASNTNQTMVSKGSSNSDPDYSFVINRSTATSKLSLYNGTGWVDSSSTITTTTDFNVVAVTWNGATLAFYNNGTSLGTSGTPGNNATSGGNFVVGGQGGVSTTNFLNGTMLELLIYTSGHTSSEVTDITRHFGNYYGLNF